MSIKISNIITPEKTIELGPVKIKLRGVDFRKEQVIESVKFQRPKTEEEASELGAEYVYRMISNCVKEVSGIIVEDENGDEKPFECEFNPNGQLTLESYTILMRALLYNGHDLTTEVSNFYNSSKLQGVKIDSKKKITKKKE